MKSNIYYVYAGLATVPAIITLALSQYADNTFDVDVESSYLVFIIITQLLAALPILMYKRDVDNQVRNINKQSPEVKDGQVTLRQVAGVTTTVAIMLLAVALTYGFELDFLTSRETGEVYASHTEAATAIVYLPLIGAIINSLMAAFVYVRESVELDQLKRTDSMLLSYDDERQAPQPQSRKSDVELRAF